MGAEESVFEMEYFGRQGSIVPPRGHQLEQVVSRVRKLRGFYF